MLELLEQHSRAIHYSSIHFVFFKAVLQIVTDLLGQSQRESTLRVYKAADGFVHVFLFILIAFLCFPLLSIRKYILDIRKLKVRV